MTTINASHSLVQAAEKVHLEITSILLHVVMVPYPSHGQINPMLNFSKALLSKYPEDLMVTFVNIKHHHDRILQTRSTTCQGDTSFLNTDQIKLNFTWVDNGLPPDFDYTNQEALHLSTYNMKAPLKQLLHTSKIPVSCVFFGTFCAWAHSAASELGIPRFMFWTQSVAMFSLYYHLPMLEANGFFPNSKRFATDDKSSNEVDDSSISTELVSYVPGVAPLHRSSFPTLFQVNDVSHPLVAVVKEQLGVIGDCNGVIINSFEELEKDACQALRAEMPSSSSVCFIGPVLPPVFLEGRDMIDATIGLHEDKTDHCLKWLDSKPKRSVLYISFGTVSTPSMEEVGAIAHGIKASKHPFLWVIRQPKSSTPLLSDILPSGFVNDTTGHGLIVPWAPQLQVLSHPSVGAFLTHCGWNSTLESLSMGVPMITCPIFADQPTNCLYVCDIWEVGMSLKNYGDGSKLESTNVERVVREMLQGGGERIRERAGKLKEAARRAVQAQGSSFIELEKLIQGIKHHPQGSC